MIADIEEWLERWCWYWSTDSRDGKGMDWCRCTSCVAYHVHVAKELESRLS